MRGENVFFRKRIPSSTVLPPSGSNRCAISQTEKGTLFSLILLTFWNPWWGDVTFGKEVRRSNHSNCSVSESSVKDGGLVIYSLQLRGPAAYPTAEYLCTIKHLQIIKNTQDEIFFFFQFGLWTVSKWPNSVCVTSLLLIKTQERILQLSQAQHWFLLATVPKHSTNLAFGVFFLFCLVGFFIFF